MARSLEECVQAHLGKMQWNAITLLYELEQATDRIKVLEAQIPKAEVTEPANGG